MPATSYPKAIGGVCLSTILGYVFSQCVDAKQLSSPTKQLQAITNHN